MVNPLQSYSAVPPSTPQKRNNSSQPSEPVVFTPSPRKEKGRKVLSKHATASIQEPSELPARIQEHGARRPLLFLTIAAALHNVAKRTGKPPSPVKVTIGKANLQGCKSQVRGFQGAHSHAAAGLADNHRNQFFKELVEDGVTPNKERLLCILKISKADLQLLKRFHYDALKIKEVLRKYIPRSSLLNGSNAEIISNATIVLPSLLNQGVDCYLEQRLRPSKIPELIEKCMQGLLTPREACEKYVIYLKQELKNGMAKLKKNITLTITIDQLACKIIKIEDQAVRKGKINQKTIKSYKENLEKLRKNWTVLTTSQKEWRLFYTLKLNFRYFILKSYEGDLRKRINLTDLRRKRNTPSALSSERHRLQSDWEKLLEYCSHEYEGTEDPPYDSLEEVDQEALLSPARSAKGNSKTKINLLSKLDLA